MKLEIESLDEARDDFYDVKKRLIEKGKRFDEVVIKSIPYDQLHLCCIGNAATAACNIKLVQEEKTRRRERFLNMEPGELKGCVLFLKREQMYDDVMYAIDYRNAPKWGDLNDRQKVWAKLTCILNHVDDVHTRLGEAVLLLRRCATTSLPSEVAMNFMQKLKSLDTTYPGTISDKVFREKIQDIADTLLAFLPDVEVVALEKHQLQDYSCTSDCFRVTA